MEKILVVEDDRDLAEMVRRWLEIEKYMVDVVYDGASALPMIKMNDYDLMILDWRLPGISGLELCQQFRSAGGNAKVLFLTGKDRIEEKEAGFAAGADDYLTKPFQMRELVMRVKALVRRPKVLVSDVLKAGYLTLEVDTHRVSRNAELLQLSPREFALLEFLMQNPGRVFSADALLNRVWESDAEASPDAVRTFIKQLRKKIDVEGQTSMIKTVHGLGYKLEV